MFFFFVRTSPGSSKVDDRLSTFVSTSTCILVICSLLTEIKRFEPLTPLSGLFMSSSMPKSAKTTERRSKRLKVEGQHSAKPKRNLSRPVILNITQNTESKTSRRKVDISADTLGDESTKPGDASLTSEREQDALLPSSFKIIAGSYERLLYGLQGTVSASSPDAPLKLEWTLKPIFIFPAHVSYIKTVAASPQGGKWLATGSGDEIIKVWDLRRRKEVGGLMQHEGSTVLPFPSLSA